MSDYLKCPYCDAYDNDFDDYQSIEDEKKHQCASCNKTFWAEADVRVQYKSRPDCELNGEKHNFEQAAFIHWLTCSKCRKSISKKDLEK